MHNIYKVVFCGDDSPVDFNYCSSFELARAFVKRYCLNHDLGMDKKDLNRPWYFCIYEEPLDKFDEFGTLVGIYDWYGDIIDPICREIGWEYGKDFLPHHLEPFEDNCSICNDILVEQIEKTMIKYA